MKQLVLPFFILWSAWASAQQKVTIGILAGGNTSTLSHTRFNQDLQTGVSAGAAIQYKLFSGLHGSLRTEYQARTLYYQSSNPYFPQSQTMHLGDLQAGLQWKKNWWYVGAGIYGQIMLKKFFQAEDPYICDCDFINFFPPVYTQRNYGGLGYYGQMGVTPRLTEKWSLLMELNAYEAFTGSLSRHWYQKHRIIAGTRLGLQRKL